MSKQEKLYECKACRKDGNKPCLLTDLDSTIGGPTDCPWRMENRAIWKTVQLRPLYRYAGEMRELLCDIYVKESAKSAWNNLHDQIEALLSKTESEK